MSTPALYTPGLGDDVTVIERYPSYCYEQCDVCKTCTRRCHWDSDRKCGVIENE